jgi:hypothetical protein
MSGGVRHPKRDRDALRMPLTRSRAFFLTGLLVYIITLAHPTVIRSVPTLLLFNTKTQER